MMINALTVNVTDQKPYVEVNNSMVEDSENIYSVTFIFDEMWDGFAKTAIFQNTANKMIVMAYLDEEGKCELHPSVLKKGRLEIGVRGVKGDQVITTSASSPAVNIKENAIELDLSSESPSPFSQTLYDDLVARIEKKEEEGGAGVTDYNDLENKPCWTEVAGMVEILPETVFVYNDDSQMFGTSGFIDGVNVGESYVIKYNGVEYQCVGQDFEGIAFGDLSGYGLSGNGEPFILLVVPEEMLEEIGIGAMVLPLDGAESVTISITTNGETVHKLENKYLDLKWLPTIRYDKKLFYSATELPSQLDKVYSDINVTTGAKCEIICDGTEYENVVKVIEGVWYIGNLHLSIDSVPDTGEPYLVMIQNSSGYYTVNATTASNESLEVYIAEAVYNEIPKEFLPDSLPIITTYYVHNLNDITENQLYSDENLTQKVMPGELNDAYRNTVLHIINTETGVVHVPIYESGRVVYVMDGFSEGTVNMKGCCAVLL